MKFTFGSNHDGAGNLISRRRILRAAGTALVLPALSSLLPKAAWGAGSAAPRKLVYWWFPDGTVQERPIIKPGGEDFGSTGGVNWFPTGTETNFSLAPLSKPFDPIKDEIIMLKGIDTGFARATGCPHDVGPRFTLTAMGKTSIDQIIGARMPTRFKTLEFGVGTWHITREDTRINYSNGQPIEPVNNPNRMFQTLFGDPSKVGTPQADAALLLQQKRRKSVLDGVLNELKTVRQNASSLDRPGLDSFESSLREVELALADVNGSAMSLTAACKMPNVDLDGVKGIPNFSSEDTGATLRNFDKVADVQIALLTLALQCDQTRVATIMFEKARSGQRYDFLPLPTMDENHGFAHRFFLSTAQTQAWNMVHVWRAQMFTKFIQKLKATPDVDGTSLLRNVAVCKTSELSTGGHGYRDMPLVIAGQCGGAFKTGRYVDFSANRKNQTQLHLTLAKAMGVELPQFPIEGGSFRASEAVPNLS